MQDVIVLCCKFTEAINVLDVEKQQNKYEQVSWCPNYSSLFNYSFGKHIAGCTIVNVSKFLFFFLKKNVFQYLYVTLVWMY